jgi:hypothetical protein
METILFLREDVVSLKKIEKIAVRTKINFYLKTQAAFVQ